MALSVPGGNAIAEWDNLEEAKADLAGESGFVLAVFDQDGMCTDVWWSE